jgi:hypothetical protein
MKPIVGWDSLRLENQIQLEDEKEDGAEPGRKLDRKVFGLSCPGSEGAAAGRVWGHVRLRWGKIGGKESRLQNGETGDDSAIWQMSRLLDLVAVVGIFGYANFGLQDLHKLFDTILLSAELLEGLEDLA